MIFIPHGFQTYCVSNRHIWNRWSLSSNISLGEGKKMWQSKACQLSPLLDKPSLRFQPEPKYCLYLKTFVTYFVYPATKYHNLRLKQALFDKFRCMSAFESMMSCVNEQERWGQNAFERRLNPLGYIGALTEYSFGLSLFCQCKG